MSKEPMSEKRLQGLREIAAHAKAQDPFSADPEERWDSRIVPGHLAEAIDEIDRLRAENEKLRAELSHAKWNLDKAGLVIAQQCAKLGNQDRKLGE